MNCGAIYRGLVFLLLLISCIILFIVHSMYFISRHLYSTEHEEVKTYFENQLFIPALIICNRMPFSQDGVNSINTNLRHDLSIRYLLEWTNPSIRENADYVQQTPTYIDQGQMIVYQYLPSYNRNQSINHMQYLCQSVINSCSYQNLAIQSYDCCKNILYHLPTTRGLCWLFHDKTMWQNSTSVMKQFTITFQMSQNSWYSSSYMRTHPGVDVYLKENTDDVVQLINELENPIRLNDKKGVRLRMHKERRVDIRHASCGQTSKEMESVDSLFQRNGTNLLFCNIMVSARYCNCHPLFAEMIPLNFNLPKDFSTIINGTEVCTLSQYDECARRYIDFAQPLYWNEPIPRDLEGYEELLKCRNGNQQPCLKTTYPGTLEQYDLPREYLNTQDYVSRLILEYDTMRVTEVTFSKNPNIYELLSYIGYNIALWFSVGHILWSLLIRFRVTMCSSNKIENKVTPISSNKECLSIPVSSSVEDTHQPVTTEIQEHN